MSRKGESFPLSSVGKESAYSAGDLGSIPGLGRSPGEGNDNSLQYYCLENPMDRGAWCTAVHGVAKNWAWLFSKPGFSNMWTENFQMLKLDLEKSEKPEIKLPTFTGSLKKQESSIKTYIFALLTTPKPSTVWITINCRKFWKRWEYQTTSPASWETCIQVRKQQLELDME